MKDLRALFKRREVILTLLLFTAPAGSFALTNQLSGVVHDFHATDAFVGRMGGAVLSGMYLVDGSLSLAACILMAAVMWWFARRSRILQTAS